MDVSTGSGLPFIASRTSWIAGDDGPGLEVTAQGSNEAEFASESASSGLDSATTSKLEVDELVIGPLVSMVSFAPDDITFRN